jgi:hypothetical protein
MWPFNQMWLFKKKARKPGEWRHEFTRALRLYLKCLIVIIRPTIPAVVIAGCWYQFIYRHDVHFSEQLEVIATAAWIPTFGILYCLLANNALNTVWTEYKTMRMAVKKYDFETFADLRDEGLSPLMHALLFVNSSMVLGGFALLKYPDWGSGFLVMLSTAYIFFLIRFIVMEIDDPCAGFWFIRSIPDAWLTIDVKKWRINRCAEMHKKFIEANCSNGQPERLAELQKA